MRRLSRIFLLKIVEKISIKEIKQETEKEKLEKDAELFHRIMKKIMKLDETKEGL